jgi:hypothetical protein
LSYKAMASTATSASTAAAKRRNKQQRYGRGNGSGNGRGTPRIQRARGTARSATRPGTRRHVHNTNYIPASDARPSHHLNGLNYDGHRRHCIVLGHASQIIRQWSRLQRRHYNNDEGDADHDGRNDDDGKSFSSSSVSVSSSVFTSPSYQSADQIYGSSWYEWHDPHCDIMSSTWGFLQLHRDDMIVSTISHDGPRLETLNDWCLRHRDIIYEPLPPTLAAAAAAAPVASAAIPRAKTTTGRDSDNKDRKASDERRTRHTQQRYYSRPINDMCTIAIIANYLRKAPWSSSTSSLSLLSLQSTATSSSSLSSSSTSTRGSGVRYTTKWQEYRGVLFGEDHSERWCHFLRYGDIPLLVLGPLPTATAPIGVANHGDIARRIIPPELHWAIRSAALTAVTPANDEDHDDGQMNDNTDDQHDNDNDATANSNNSSVCSHSSSSASTKSSTISTVTVIGVGIGVVAAIATIAYRSWRTTAMTTSSTASSLQHSALHAHVRRMI